MDQWKWGNLTEGEELKRWHCSRFIELKNIVHVSSQIIDKNLFFRFFIIVHADKGFVTRGGAFNSRLLSFLFTLFLVTMAVFTLLPMTMSFLVEQNYPANTLQGKVQKNQENKKCMFFSLQICLNLPLDDDLQSASEVITSHHQLFVTEHVFSMNNELDLILILVLFVNS